MQNWITDILEQFGYLGIFLMMMIENLFPPIPSEIVLPFGGFLTTYTNLTATGVIIAATVGSLIGAMILYSIGLIIDVERLEKIIDRYGHLLRLSKEELYKAEKWFMKYGYWTVFFCRMIPLIRSLISLPAGMSHMKISVFLILTTMGSFIWNGILIFLGLLLGVNWERILLFINIYSTVVYIALAFICLIIAYWYIKKIKSQSS